MLTHLLNQKPGQSIAFLPEADIDVLAETIAAFANSEGGTVVLGVDLLGRPTDSIQADEVEAALGQAVIRTRPPAAVEWQQHNLPGGCVVTLRVPRSPELHALQDGRVLIRQRAENRPMGGEAIRHLAAAKSVGDFETSAIPGSSLLDFDRRALDEYLQHRAKRGRRPLNDSLERHLVEIGAMTADGEATASGLLVFGKRPQIYLPHSGALFVKFYGKEPRGRDGQAGYGRRVEIEGPLPRVMERAWSLVWEEMRVEAVVSGLKREELPEYPRFAVREALVNAFCHRDYRLKGRKVEIRMYEDRLEVISPGGLPGYMTLDNLVEEHFSRNPRLVASLFEWGYIEELGLGIDRMIEEMLQSGHPPPEFKATPYSFTVKLFNAIDRAPVMDWEVNMNERQIRAMTHLQQKGRITNRDYQTLCPNVSAETLRLDLVDLVDKGLLLKIGDKRGTYYILK